MNESFKCHSLYRIVVVGVFISIRFAPHEYAFCLHRETMWMRVEHASEKDTTQQQKTAYLADW